ncbi:3-hydroxyacyl-CoA dehydrogenase NAD-binding domain-containing protein [Rhodobacteraceae bacterium KMM 6894]|nr:3-hydroxyacyl-CoA dehydrogenase NAD-binding domain-containing protein [Rhodobacteraceae bacterium KMM 6894]
MTVSITRDGPVAIVTIDNPPVNALGQALRQDLWDAVATLDSAPDVRAVVLICAGRTFIAGADVSEFGKPPVPPHLPDLVARIESATTPWVAAIHGSALGGGLEVAMGCRFRVAVDSASLGLPEVGLGIVPGAGGTVRTPRLIGTAAAVDLVTSGKPVKAAKALDLGLIDAVFTDDLLANATKFAADLKDPLPLPVSARAPEVMDDDFWATAEVSTRKKAKGAAAPLRALTCIRNATESDFDSAMQVERDTFLDLRTSDQAAALRYVFFAERAAPRPARLRDVTPTPIHTTAVIGGGTMGAGIAAALRNAGLPVILIERDDDAVKRGLANLRKIFDAAAKRGLLSDDAVTQRMEGVTGTTDYAALADTDLVVEAVFEDISVKHAVFAQLGTACRADAVLATNTSYLDPQLIAKGLPNPERFIGLHFFSPANIMKLLEIVPTKDTAQPVLAAAFALAKRLGKIPVEAGICEGFIGNRILKRYRAAAEDLLRQGTPIDEVDAAMRDFGFAMGPFEAQDLGGLDIAYLQRCGARDAGQDVPQTLGDILVEAGRKGQKTAGGWYDYTEGSRKPLPSGDVAALLEPHVTPAPMLTRAQISARMLAEMAEEGAAILAEGIATQASDIDLVEIHGYGFARWRGGPMHHAKMRGADRITQDLGHAPSPALMSFLTS